MSVPQRKTRLNKTGGTLDDLWEDVKGAFIGKEPVPTQPGVPANNGAANGFDIKAYLPYIILGIIVWYFFFRD